MGKALTVLRHEFRQTIRRKSYLLITISLPLMLLLGYSIYQAVQSSGPSTPTQIEIGYIDEVGDFTGYTKQNDITFILYTSEEEAKKALLDDEIEEYLIIPPDYLTTGTVSRYTLKSELTVPTQISTGIQDFLLSNLLAGKVSPALLDRAEAPAYLNTVQLDQSGNVVEAKDEFSKFFLPIIFGLMFIFAIFFSSGFLLQSVSEEKENRIIEIILSSISARQLLTGKVLGLGTAGFLQIAIWFASIKIFADTASLNIPQLSNLTITPGLLAWGIVFFILGYLLYAAIYAGIGSIGSTAREAQGLSGIMIVPALLPIWLNYYIVNVPNSIFARVTSLLPITAPTSVMMRLTNESISTWEIALSLVILLVSVVLVMWLAAKVFRVFLLMYGKRPALREIVRYVRES